MRPLLVAFLVALTACGGDDPDTEPPASPVPAAPDGSSLPGARAGADDDTVGADAAAVPGAAETESTAGAPSGDETSSSTAPRSAERGEAGRSLYTIQVAAFVDPASAEGLVDRLRRQGWPVWSSGAEVQGRRFQRVRVGALPTVDEARRLGRALAQRYGWPVWLAPVTSGDRPPADAVEATRQALSRG